MRMERQTRSQSFFTWERAYPRYLRSNKHNYFIQLRRKSWSNDRGTNWPTKTSQSRYFKLRLINLTKPINFPNEEGKERHCLHRARPTGNRLHRTLLCCPRRDLKWNKKYLTLPGKAETEHQSNSEKLWALCNHAHIHYTPSSLRENVLKIATP